MIGNVNWNGVWQSLLDFWLPTIAFVVLIIVAILVIRIIRRRKK